MEIYATAATAIVTAENVQAPKSSAWTCGVQVKCFLCLLRKLINKFCFSGADRADVECYEKFNILGIENGNCGYDDRNRPKPCLTK